MKTAEILLSYMDWLQKVAGIINTFVDKSLEIFQRLKLWVQKAIDYIERAIDSLVESIGGRRTDFRLMTEEYLFV
jgi:hypothetical protein